MCGGLNVPASEDDVPNDVFDLQEQQDDDANDLFNLDEAEDHHDGKCITSTYPFVACSYYFRSHYCFFTVLDLNLPLDEFGAVDLDFVQNLAGNFF